MAQSPKGRLKQYMVTVHFTRCIDYFIELSQYGFFARIWVCHSLEMKPANEALYFGEKDEGNSRFSDPESSYSVWCCFLGCLFPEVMEKNPQIMYSSWEKSCWNIHVDLMNWTFFFFRSPTCQICWRRASATAVVAVVFLADRLNKHMIHSPGRWTCAGCNALAALLCDMVFQYDDSVGSCWNIWNVYTVCIYIYVYAHFFPRNKQW